MIRAVLPFVALAACHAPETPPAREVDVAPIVITRAELEILSRVMTLEARIASVEAVGEALRATAEPIDTCDDYGFIARRAPERPSDPSGEVTETW